MQTVLILPARPLTAEDRAIGVRAQERDTYHELDAMTRHDNVDARIMRIAEKTGRHLPRGQRIENRNEHVELLAESTDWSWR